MRTKFKRQFTYEDVRRALDYWMQRQGYSPVNGIKITNDCGFLVEECELKEQTESAKDENI